MIRDRTGSGAPWTPALALAAAAAFSLLAILVAFGQLDRIDSYAVRNLMPFHAPSHHSTSRLEDLLAYHGHEFHAGRALRLPASVLISSLLMLAACAVLWRRGRPRAAVVWLAAFVAATIVELACKLAIAKPTLYEIVDGELSPFGLRNSFPSGHATRAAILAALLVFLWRPLWPLLAAWLALVLVTLELDGIHTPSDIVGGLLLASTAVLTAVWLSAGEPRAWRNVSAQRGTPEVTHDITRETLGRPRAAPPDPVRGRRG